jgi:hypothetical protein
MCCRGAGCYAVAVKPVAREFGGSGVAEYVIDTHSATARNRCGAESRAKLDPAAKAALGFAVNTRPHAM